MFRTKLCIDALSTAARLSGSARLLPGSVRTLAMAAKPNIEHGVSKVVLVGEVFREPIQIQRATTITPRVVYEVKTVPKSRTGSHRPMIHSIVCTARSQTDRVLGELQKGTMVYVEGKLMYREFLDDRGTHRNAAHIFQDNFEVLANGKEPTETPDLPAEEFNTTSSQEEQEAQ